MVARAGIPITFGTLTFPVVPTGSYEMALSLTRYQGSGAMAVYIPVGQSRISLVLGWKDGEVSALHKITGETDEEDKVSVTPANIPSGRAFVLNVKVEVNAKKKTGKIKVKMSGKEYLWWDGDLSALSRADEPELADTGAPGVGALQARVAVNSARLRMLRGKLVASKGQTRGPIAEGPTPAQADEIRRRIQDEIRRRLGRR